MDDEVRFTLGPWEINTLNGRLPVVREIKMPHGEASTYRSSVKTVIGRIFHLDFGYGTKEDEGTAILIATAPELREALKDLIAVIDKAGLLNLSNGVQLGQTSWYCKASDCLEYARRTLAKSTATADTLKGVD